jgi:chromosomal replication initiation ATPase DnaA
MTQAPTQYLPILVRDGGVTEWERIARVFQRDHTTVMSGIRRHAERCGE